MRVVTVLVILFLVVTGLSAQHVAYSEILPMLKDRQFDNAESQLRQYLYKDEYKNPSALIYMGEICYEKALDHFLADEEDLSIAFLDSALFFYKRAQGLLTQSELDKNSHYYDGFFKKKRIKLPQLRDELDKKIDKIRKKIEKTRAKSATVQSASQIKPNGKYYALLIGVSKYNDHKLDLNRPQRDAADFKNILTKYYTFSPGDIKLLNNPTRQEILKELFSLRKKITKDDNLLIFFAGHGYWDKDASQGYWWPKDAMADDPSFWLSNSDLREQIRGIKSAHTLLISDACFSGGIFKTRDVTELVNAPSDIIMLYKQPSRRAMTSGTLTSVPDQSVFFDYLMKKLIENSEKFLSSKILFSNFRQAVINNSMVVPQDGVITDTGDEGGDFIFIRRD